MNLTEFLLEKQGFGLPELQGVDFTLLDAVALNALFCRLPNEVQREYRAHLHAGYQDNVPGMRPFDGGSAQR